MELARACWAETAERAGLGSRTWVHGVGDGAPWIAEMFGEQFGRQGKHLIDFYHLTEYVAAAGQKLVGSKRAPQWLRKQKARLLPGQFPKILRRLEPYQESENALEKPVRSAYRYLMDRRQHLHNDEARKAELPIGSGEVESGCRRVIQQRLKISGAWWRETNANRIARTSLV